MVYSQWNFRSVDLGSTLSQNIYCLPIRFLPQNTATSYWRSVSLQELMTAVPLSSQHRYRSNRWAMKTNQDIPWTSHPLFLHIVWRASEPYTIPSPIATRSQRNRFTGTRYLTQYLIYSLQKFLFSSKYFYNNFNNAINIFYIKI